MKIIKAFNQKELKQLFHANDKITEENYYRYQKMDLRKGLSPALLAYQGLAFSNMAPQVFTEAQWRYAKTHIKILSGFYGMLSAVDGVVPYRLEMQTKLSVGDAKDLYEFWGRS